MFNLAHLSDVHLGPMPDAPLSAYFSKRIIGALSWRFRRRGIHSLDVLNRLVTDIKRHNVDHIAFTGDLVNIALPKEFTRGAQWLSELGGSEFVSFVPGNHDAYVPVDWADGLALWGDYMIGDLRTPGVRTAGNNAALFPYVRQRRNIAMIGVSSGVPAPWNKAWGELGQRQLEALDETLKTLHERGFYRILMIHHPPLRGMAKDRKMLRDADDLKIVLEKRGVELVLHGHNHVHMRSELETKTGLAQIVGVPSASSFAHKGKPAAAWYNYAISRKGGAWSTNVTVRSYDESQKQMVTSAHLAPLGQLCLDCDTQRVQK